MHYFPKKICILLILFSSTVNSEVALPQSSSFYDSGQRLGLINNGVATIACADINNDGFMDLVLASVERGTIIQLYLNDGRGNFTRANDVFPVTEDPNPLWNFGISLSDFDRNGLLDIATADAWRGVNVYLNRGNNGFQLTQAILVPAVNEVKGIDAADVNHDGAVDLVFGGHNGIPDRADRIYLNDGSGYFTDSGQRIGEDVTWKTIFGDLNNDGNIDYVSINRYRVNSAKIHVNNGTGVFTQIIDIPTTETDDSYDVKLVDLNNDSFLDIVIANSFDPQNVTTDKVFINKGNLNFMLIEDNFSGTDYETKDIGIIDIDKDGFKDIILGNHNIANTVYRNNGTGHFTKMNVEIPSYQTHAIAACDVNNDGLLDIITGNASDSCYRVYLQRKSYIPPGLFLLLE